MTKEHAMRLRNQRSYVQHSPKTYLTRADLPSAVLKAVYQLETANGSKLVALSATPCQVLEALLLGPVSTLSAVHLAAYVSALRKLGFDIETVWLKGSGERQAPSVYYLLHSIVTRISEEGYHG